MPKTSLLFAIVLLLGCSDMQAQIHRDLFANYELYRERSIETRRFKHADLTRLIEQLEPPLSYQVAGKSMEGRDIYMVKAGNGPVKVLLWSQMHGDESTATMALLDIFNFLGRQDGLSSLRGRLLQSLTIYFIPMLNPACAEDQRQEYH